MAITDLTNTTWVVPAGWGATQKLVFFVSGELSIGDTDYGLPSLTALTIDSTRISFAHGSWDDNINISPSQSFTITFENVSAQSGYTVDQLISWLETYGELQGGDTPTDAVTIEYNGAVIAAIEGGKAASISCKDKLMRTDIVITVPEMGGEDVPEWDGSYTVTDAVELISFTIEGTSYEAEEGMTWKQWVESSYNTGGYYITNLAVHKNSTTYVYNEVSTNVIIADTAYELRVGGGGAD